MLVSLCVCLGKHIITLEEMDPFPLAAYAKHLIRPCSILIKKYYCVYYAVVACLQLLVYASVRT